MRRFLLFVILAIATLPLSLLLAQKQYAAGTVSNVTIEGDTSIPALTSGFYRVSASGNGLARIGVWAARTNADLYQASSWEPFIFNASHTVPCASSTSCYFEFPWTPVPADDGEWYLAVNVFTQGDEYGSCTGNPVTKAPNWEFCPGPTNGHMRVRVTAQASTPEPSPDPGPGTCSWKARWFGQPVGPENTENFCNAGYEPSYSNPYEFCKCVPIGTQPTPTPSPPPPPPPCLEGIDKDGNLVQVDVNAPPDPRIVKCTKVYTGIGGIWTDPKAFVKSIFSVLLGFAGGIALLLIIISGYRLLTSRGDPEKIQGARETITAAIVGLLFIIFSVVILEVIGVDILRIPGLSREEGPLPSN